MKRLIVGALLLSACTVQAAMLDVNLQDISIIAGDGTVQGCLVHIQGQPDVVVAAVCASIAQEVQDGAKAVYPDAVLNVTVNESRLNGV